MSGKLCVKGCGRPRWLGPHGNNPRLTMCQEHQQEYWHEQYKKRHPDAKPGKRGRKKYVPVTQLPPPPEPVVVEVEQAPAPAPAPEQKMIKVLLIDHGRDVVQRFEIPVVSERKLSDTRNAERVVQFYVGTGHVVVEVGEKKL